MLTGLELLAAVVALVAASDSFTNAVEWVGALFGLTRSALGAVVAAIGSSMPETMVAIVALLVLRDPSSQQVGIGAVLGAPFMLSTLVFATIGTIALTRKTPSGKRQSRLRAEPRVAGFGLALFALTFLLVIGASFAPTIPVRLGAAVLVLATYAAYLLYHFRIVELESEEAPPPLRFSPRSVRPPLGIVLAQLVIALVVTVFASRWFVASVSKTAIEFAVPALVVSLFLSPIATELPEAMNVILWMRRGEDELALGNVIGAMMFQTSIASTIAMLASPWRLGVQAYAASAAAFLAVVVVLTWMLARRAVEAFPLVACAIFYVAYVAFAATVTAK